ncbi:alpha/beta hydrolase [Bacillus sp. ISL-34]|uniref:alpha/beta hydrolase n=1 Tax=Bacillus sp. ISL-34 TaxID=2819121 RepID=UPI001BE7C43B|nr:alpha/beta hydrolase [Bacillus sp. ISL-34]MBT2645141.1 alpha/beta hydrolase [Bacillus sp. ISL-34]
MKKFSIAATCIPIILVAMYGFTGNYFYNFALNPDKEKDFLSDNPHLAQSEAVSGEMAQSSKLEDAEFTKEHQPDEMSIVSTDQLKLSAKLYENNNQDHKWAIVVHGYTGNNTQMIRWVRNFYGNGYNVLAPDLRGHGKSEGDYIGMGWDDRKDMLLWIKQIIDKDPQADIALFGISMGGATVMMTSGEKLPSNVKVIIEDCGYSSVMDVFTYQLDDLFGLPKFPVMNAANTVTKLRAGYDLNEASAVKQVLKSKTPMLFIHGEEDSFVPYSMLDDIYNAANVDKDKLIIPGAGHGEAELVDPEKYWNKVWDFVDKYME